MAHGLTTEVWTVRQMLEKVAFNTLAAFGRLFPFTGFARKCDEMFTIWFSEGGNRLAEREWPFVPHVGDTVTLRDSTGLFEVIRVHWQEYTEATNSLIAHVSLRSAVS
jgi:hypothetical protein